MRLNHELCKNSAVAGVLAASENYTNAIATTASISIDGPFVLFKFAPNSGQALTIGFGTGQGYANGSSIPIPAGYNYKAVVSTDFQDSSPGNGNNHNRCYLTGTTITVTTADNQGNYGTSTANWFAVVWKIG